MSLEEFTMKRVRRQFTVEFKKNAVSLVVDEKRSVSESRQKSQYFIKNFKYLVTPI